MPRDGNLLRKLKQDDLGYRLGCNWITKRTWFRKPRNKDLVPSNFAGRLIFGSFREFWTPAASSRNANIVALSWWTCVDKSSYWWAFSVLTCCRSPISLWFSCSNATNLVVSMSSSKRTRIYSCLLMDSITEMEKRKKEKQESLQGLLEEEKEIFGSNYRDS